MTAAYMAAAGRRPRKRREVRVSEPDEVAVPSDMAARSGLRSYVRTGDEHLGQRPEELLARLARACRLHAITDAILFPDSPSLRAQWSESRQRWLSPTTGEPVDAVAIRDRAVHFHRGGESAPTGVVPFRKLEDLVQHVLALEELERFRALSEVRVAGVDLADLVARVRELGPVVDEVVQRLDLLRADAPLRGDEGPVPVEASPDPRPAAPRLALVSGDDERSATVTPPEPVRELTSAAPVPRTWSERLSARVLGLLDLERRDGGALFWLCVAGVVSAFTTHNGARAIGLPDEIATVATAFVVGFLFTLLVGLALKHAPIVKLGTELVLASACVFCGFFTYYEAVSHDTRVAVSSERAIRAHEVLVGELVGTHRAELESARLEAAALARQRDDEIARGTGTGRSGYGPAAKQLAEQARAAESRVASLAGQLVTVEPLVASPVAGLDPDAVHRLDLSIWSSVPAEWRSQTAPERGAYVDLDAPTSRFAIAVGALRAYDADAIVAIVCAALVEGIMVLCGFSIEIRRRDRLVRRLTRATTRVVREVRDARASVAKVRELEARPRFAYLDDDEVSGG